MNTAVVALALVPLAAASLVLMADQPGTPSTTQPIARGDGALADAARVLDDFHLAASKADFDGYFKHWAADSVFLGTDATERWVGDEFRAFAKPHFDKGKGWTYTPRGRKLSPAAGGSVVFFDELLHSESYGTCRGSGLLERRGDQWVILQYNLSISIPNDLAKKFVGLIREHEGAPPAKPPAEPGSR